MNLRTGLPFCVCGSCDFCRQDAKERFVERMRTNVIATAKWCRAQGMSLPSELRTALEQLAVAEQKSGGRL